MFRRILRAAALLVASVLLIGFVLDFPRLSPPHPVVIETGPVGGSYHGNALRYAQHLTAAGFKVEVRPNPQSLDSIGHVNGDGPKTHIAFTAQAIDSSRFPNVRSAGVIQTQPLFTFLHKRLEGRVRTLTDLKGARLVMPPERSATSEAARAVLALFGVDPGNTSFTYLPIVEAAAALKAGSYDAGLFMLTADNPLAVALGTESTLWLPSLPAAPAVAGKLPWLRAVNLPVGTFDIGRSLPPREVEAVGAMVNVVVREDLHPAVLFELLRAMDGFHGGATLVNRAGEFPSLTSTELQPHPLAAEYRKTGVPWLYRHFSPFLARMFDSYLLIFIALVLLVEGYKVWYYLRELWEEATERLAIWALKRLDRSLDREIPAGRISRSLLHFAEHVILRHETARGHELLDRVRSRLDSA
jgi:TRAP-type uncharacterized transport system substrate-binding protein